MAADYHDLLRRAINALPENTAEARASIYERARVALVDQLRALEPPLTSSEISDYQMTLEECVRKVEEEASAAK